MSEVDLSDWVFVYEGGSVFLGKKHVVPGYGVLREVYLEPVYLYVVLSRPIVIEGRLTGAFEQARELRSLLAYDEIRRKDLHPEVRPILCSSLTPAHQDELVALIHTFERERRANQAGIAIVQSGAS